MKKKRKFFCIFFVNDFDAECSVSFDLIVYI